MELADSVLQNKELVNLETARESKPKKIRRDHWTIGKFQAKHLFSFASQSERKIRDKKYLEK